MFKKGFKIYISAFGLPILFIFLALIPLQIFPFGDGSFIHWDAEIQYVNFLGYFKSLFTSNNDIFYTFSRMGGASMLDFSALYLFSPLNFLLFLFPNEHLNIGLEFLMILRIGLCGLNFAYFLNKEFSYTYKNLIFSSVYALCGYNLMYISNTMFFDGIILLPIVITGINRIVNNNKSKLYIFSLVLTIFTNAYIGYVSLLFSGTFFVYKMLLANIKEKTQIFNRIKTYIISTILSLGLTACLLLPVKLALEGGKYNFFSEIKNLFAINYNILPIIAKFYTNTFVEDAFWVEITPFIFVGILLFMLIMLYFFNSNIKKKEKIITSVYLLLLASSFFWSITFILFNMGIVPNGTIFRFAFIFEFFIIYIAYKSFLNINCLNGKQLSYCGILFIILTTVIFSKHYSFINNSCLFQDLIIYLALLVLIYFMNNKYKVSKTCFLIIILIHFCNLFANTQNSLASQTEICRLSPSIKTFSENYKGIKKAFNYINENDKSFFRTEVTSTFTEFPKVASSTEAVSMLHNYNAVSHYSSVGKTKIAEFYENIGFNGYLPPLIVSYSEQGMIFPIFFMGIKYIISPISDLPFPYKKLYKIDNYIHHNPVSVGYREIFNLTDLYVYKNPYSLPIAFSIDNNENLYKNFDYAQKDFQNNLIKIIANEDFGNVLEYQKVSFNKKLSNNGIKNSIERKIKINSNNKMYLIAKADKGLLNIFSYNKGIKISYPDTEKKSYIDFYNLDQQTFYIGDNFSGKFLNFKYNFLDKINPDKADLDVYLVYEDMNVLKKYYDKLSQNSCDLTKVTSSHLIGECEIKKDNQLMFLTIPYDKNWHIYVDNQRVTQQKMFNAMMSFPISKGMHKIDMRYIPSGLFEGIMCSGISLLILIILIINKKI